MNGTAQLVQIGVALEAACGRADALPPTTLSLARSAAGRFARSGIWRSVLSAAQTLTIPGLSHHFVCRKHLLRRWCEEAIGSGVERVLILGPGGDGLGPHLAMAYPSVEIVEVEHPARCEARRVQLASLAVTPRNLRVEARDLNRRGVLDEFVSSATPSVVVAEGVLMYLRPAAVLGLLQSASRGRSCRGVMASFATPRADGRLAFERARPWAAWYLAARGEPWRWATSAGRVCATLRQHGFRVQALAGAPGREQLRPCARLRALPCAGECLLWAQRA